MKKIFLFKCLLDVFFILVVVTLAGVVIMSPERSLELYTKLVYTTEPYSVLEIVMVVVYIVAFMLFTLGVWQIRCAARYMLKQNLFKEEIYRHLQKGGKSFLFSGSVLLLQFVVYWFVRFVFHSLVFFQLKSDFKFMLIITIFGVFLMIQSEFMKKAMELKNENDLTI